MTEAKHSLMQITRAKLMQLPKEELVTELLGALRVVVSQHAAASLHAELVAGLEEISSLDFGVCGDIARALIQKAKRP